MFVVETARLMLNALGGFASFEFFGLQMSSAEANRSHQDLFDVCLMYLNKFWACQLTFRQEESARCDQLVRSDENENHHITVVLP